MYEVARAKETRMRLLVGPRRTPALPHAGARSHREMHGEPDRRAGGVGPFDTMAAVGRQVDVVAGPERARPVLALDEEPGGAGEHHDPLVQGLVVPEPRRARLPGRDDGCARSAPPATGRASRPLPPRPSRAARRRDFAKPAWRPPRLPSRASRPIARS